MKQKFVLTLCAGAALSLAAACSSTDTNTAGNTSNRSNANVPANSSNMNTSGNMNAGNTNAMTSASPAAGENPMVGGAAMLPTRDIIDNAVNSKDHTTLVTAVKAAGLVDTLKGAGPFTVFAPTNAAFEKLPKGEVDGLLKPGSKATLTKILTYHVVPGKQDAAAITKAIEAGGGKATFKTVQGGTLTAALDGKNVTLTDEKGGKSTVTIANVNQSNGVIHVVDTVLMPK
jgi:uncharacterized surface protein with fasciclin (FAS1) repeats